MKEITRRLFFKVGCACMAAVPLAATGIANAREITGNNEAFRFTVESYNPLMPGDFKINFKGKNGNIEVNKYDKEGRKIKKSLIVNGRAATILQFCRGRLSLEKIVEMYSIAYEEDPENNSDSVLKYIKFLFDKGFIVLASPSYLSEEELKNGRGITVPRDDFSYIFVVSETDQELNLAF